MNKLPHVPQPEMGIRHHAVLFGLFARNSMDLAGDNGRDAIRTAVQTYGLERGRRMAKRTRADGVEPSVMSYLAYGEWKDAESRMIVEGKIVDEGRMVVEGKIVDEGRMIVEVAAMTPVFQTKVKSCVWHEAWKEYGLEEFGHLYCEHIDGSLVEGYLGENPLQVKSILTLQDDCCHFIWNGFDRTPEHDRVFQELKENVGTRHIRGFDYHTAHLYSTFVRVLKDQLGAMGEKIIEKTVDDFKSLFTEEVFDVVLLIQDVDFTFA